MNWIVEFVVPLSKVTIFIAFFGGIMGFICYKFYLLWVNKLKYTFKYLFKNYPEEILELCDLFYNKNLNYYEVKKDLLLDGIDEEYVKEVLYVYKKYIKSNKKEVKK